MRYRWSRRAEFLAFLGIVWSTNACQSSGTEADSCPPGAELCAECSAEAPCPSGSSCDGGVCRPADGSGAGGGVAGASPTTGGVSHVDSSAGGDTGGGPVGSGSGGSGHNQGGTGTGSASSTGGTGNGTTTGGEPGTGGSGAQATGGETTGLAGAAGAAGDPQLPDGQCRERYDCPADVVGPLWIVWFCVAPHEVAPESFVSGVAPCTLTPCPGDTYPAQPSGTGTSCTSSDDCPTSDGSGAPAASLCVDGACTACSADVDCGEEQICASIFAPSLDPFNTCVGCVDAADCSSPTPHCVHDTAVSGNCVECSATAHCADGICSEGSCVPQCESDADCPDPARPCSDQHRCEARACAGPNDCGPNLDCNVERGACERMPCTDDAECVGRCVNGVCHEGLGTCRSQTRGS